MSPARRRVVAALAAAWLPASAGAADKSAPYPTPVEPPALRDAVAAGTLPPVAARLPGEPLIVTVDPPGRHGGTLRTLIRGSRDPRMLYVNGYARLVRYDADLALQPDILKAVDVEDGRSFTLRLRDGHRWSDGHPFTAEDFRYWWHDVANNMALSPHGPPAEMLVGTVPPAMDVVDPRTVRFTWPRPNPAFLPALAAASPLLIYRPAHYLKRFHADHADAADLAGRVEDAGARSWADLHGRHDRMYRMSNPDLPTLQPWRNTSRRPATRYLATRNPYFHRVDQAGRQLPYIDQVVLMPVAPDLIAAKSATGDSDLQAVGLALRDITVLRDAAHRGGFRAALWPTARGSHLAVYPNLNARDPAWRPLLRNRLFRRALSLAIDRREINRAIYAGIGRPRANTLLPASPLHDPADATAWTEHDPARAGDYLDALGLDRRDAAGRRLLPDGRRAALVVAASGVDPSEGDVLLLLRDHLAAVGLTLHIRNSSRQAFRQRVASGEVELSVFYGVANGLATARTAPDAFVPTSDKQLNWPLWGLYAQSNGAAGEAPTVTAVQALAALGDRWRAATAPRERRALWRQILEIHRDEVLTIGLVGGVPQPVVIADRLRGLPERGLYSWEPGAYFGIHDPATFWLAN